MTAGMVLMEARRHFQHHKYTCFNTENSFIE